MDKNDFDLLLIHEKWLIAWTFEFYLASFFLALPQIIPIAVGKKRFLQTLFEPLAQANPDIQLLRWICQAAATLYIIVKGW